MSTPDWGSPPGRSAGTFGRIQTEHDGPLQTEHDGPRRGPGEPLSRRTDLSSGAGAGRGEHLPEKGPIVSLSGTKN